MSSRLLAAIAIGCAALVAAGAAEAQGPKRVALVIGNGAYQSLSKLNNPGADAGRMAEMLKANGFDVLSCDGVRPGCFDLTQQGLTDALDAKAAFEQAALKARDADNPRLRYWATLGLGDVALAQGSLPSARRLYETALAIAEPIAKADPGNERWQRDLSVSHSNIGLVLKKQGNLPDALKSFKASLAIVERLAKAAPDNTEWQREVYSALWFVADVEIDQGKLSHALEKLVRAREIMERLAKADPDHANWQTDLSVSHTKIGDVLRAQGNLPAALESFKADRNEASLESQRRPRPCLNAQQTEAEPSCSIRGGV